MEQLTDIINRLELFLTGEWFIILLLGTGVFFSIYLRFPQIRHFGHAVKVVLGKYDKKEDEGDASHFQALTAALSGTVGTGNIAGVALAVHIGGPSALFWMLVTAALGMATKLVEVSLALKYREKTEDGTMSGGPMYYMDKRLGMKWMAVIFTVATIFSSFCLPQINNLATVLQTSFGIKTYITGLIFALLIGFIMIGGVKRLVKITEKLVPAMTVLYFIGAFSVLIYNYDNLIPSFLSIFSGVFTGSAATGGFLGAGFIWTFNRGVTRGLYSNEAGQGSAPIIHAVARTNEPLSEGMVSILEPFIDTVVICFLTGMVLLSSGTWKEKFENKFQYADMTVLEGTYREENPAHRREVSAFLSNTADIPLFTGQMNVENGRILSDVTLIHARSFADDVVVSKNGKPFTGNVTVSNGAIGSGSDGNNSNVTLEFKGQSLIHSANLSTEAFGKGFFGSYGKYIIPICLMLFSFSTSISWSYYGNRAVTYLLGSRYILYYQIVYVVIFFFASIADTSTIWAYANIATVLMALPNLISILLLRKEFKQMLNDYFDHKRYLR